MPARGVSFAHSQSKKINNLQPLPHSFLKFAGCVKNIQSARLFFPFDLSTKKISIFKSSKFPIEC